MSFFKVTAEEFTKFIVDYYDGARRERLGQAFYNEFYPRSSDPNTISEIEELNRLFYMEDNQEVIHLIMTEYVEDN